MQQQQPQQRQQQQSQWQEEKAAAVTDASFVPSGATYVSNALHTLIVDQRKLQLLEQRQLSWRSSAVSRTACRVAAYYQQGMGAADAVKLPIPAAGHLQRGSLQCCSSPCSALPCSRLVRALARGHHVGVVRTVHDYMLSPCVTQQVCTHVSSHLLLLQVLLPRTCTPCSTASPWLMLSC
jgi:hypothetical protein